MAARKSGLGRGLDALFADAAPIREEDYTEDAYIDLAEENKKSSSEENISKDSKDSSSKEEAKPKKKSQKETKKVSKDQINANSDDADDADDIDRIIYINLNDIKPNRAQPRKHFDEEKLRELALSIETNGVIQPLIVRKAEVGYELVAGERRWRASRYAGLKSVPCIIRNFDDKQNAIVAIIENMQREDLDAIEEAVGLMAMTKKYGFTQEQVATSLGKSRAYIANSMRLLKLPEEIQGLIAEGKISAAHGRTIINVEDKKKQLEICEKIMKEGLSVRATERLSEKIKDESKPERKKRTSSKRSNENKSPEILQVEQELRTILGTKVSVLGEKEGKIEIEYYSTEELNRLIDALRGAF